jgi:hypothetical protein
MGCSSSGSLKKRAKSAHSSIVPLDDDAPAASMYFSAKVYNLLLPLIIVSNLS